MQLTRFALVACLLAIPAAAGAGSPDFGPVRERIHREIDKNRIPSIAVAVTRDGSILWEEAFGWANRESMLAATPDTVYTLCSVAKPVTAVGLMTLVQRGRIALDRPINEYLGDPGLRSRVGDADAATVRRVANHTAGLPRWYDFFYDDEPIERPPMEETIRRYGNLVWEPGTYRYSNLGYGVLDYLIEKVSGKTFPAYMSDEVFAPLGMTHSAVLIPARLEPFAAVRYDRAGTRLPSFDTDNRGGGAVFSSAHDMARFGMFVLKDHRDDQKPILTDRWLDEMIRPTADADRGRRIGVAWQLATTNKGVGIVEHWGSMPGGTTAFSFVPSADVSMVVLSNGDRVGVTRIRDLILEALDLASPPGDDDEDHEQPQDLFPSAILTGAWKGMVATYQGDVPLTLEFRPDGDVHATLGKELPTLLSQVSYTEDGILEGIMAGTIDSDDVRARPWPHDVILRVVVRDNHMQGEATAYSDAGFRSTRLAHWVKLEKQLPQGQP